MTLKRIKNFFLISDVGYHNIIYIYIYIYIICFAFKEPSQF